MIAHRTLSESWEFREVGQEEWLPATVPGAVQQDLIRAGRLADPYYRMNEFEAQALEDKDWEYRGSFSLTAEDVAADELNLVFEGIDTYGDVYLNDIYLGSTENMFHAHRFDVTETSRQGENALRVVLHSAITTIRTLAENSPLDLISSTERARPYIRKAQYAYGWDWGPRLVQIGLWRPVRLEIVRRARVVSPYAYTRSLDAGVARVHVEAEVDSYVDADLTAEVRIALDGVTAASTRVPVTNVRGVLGLDATLEVPEPRLWWPNGYGEQPLYDVTIRILDGDEALDETAFRSACGRFARPGARRRGQSFIRGERRAGVARGELIPAASLPPRLTADYEEYIAWPPRRI